jgi:hypothetical protein
VADWRMMLNDTYGDCTIAGVGHALEAWNAQTGEHDPIPSDPTIRSTYFALTGGQDSGCVEADVLQTWHRKGLFGATIAGYAPVPTSNVEGFQQAVAYYGGAYLGVALPESAQEQFAAGEHWTVVPGSPIEGGHCILAVGYDQHAAQCVTWGAVVNVSYPWLAKYLTETWAILSHEFVEAPADKLRLDLKSLQADLAAL